MVRWGKQAAVQAALGRSQSQISRDLSGLEKSLGVRLLDRVTRKPTPSGDVLLAYAEQVLEGWASAREQLRGASVATGTVTLVAPGEVHEAVLVPLLSRLCTRWEGLRPLTAVAAPAECGEMIRAGAADIGVLPLGNHEGLNTRPLCSARLRAAVSSASEWALRKSVPLNMGREVSLLLNSHQTGMLEDLVKQVSEWKMRICHLGGGRHTLFEAVAARLGVAWVLLFEDSGDPLTRALPAQVVLKPVSGMPARVPFCIAVRKGRPPGGLVEFVLREVMRHFRH
jgi:DNA-binding transcriptional LysR family regulator